MGLEALGGQPLYHASPDEPEVRLGDVLEVPIRPLHVSGIDPRHPRKVLTHVRTPDFSGRREEVPFVFRVW